jgi:hypothetical protein
MPDKTQIKTAAKTYRVDYLKAVPKKNHQSRFKTIIQGGLTVMISVIAIFAVVKAGSLLPPSSPSSPAATGYSLSDIYSRLTTNATSTESGHAFAPSGSPTGTMFSLKQIYDAIPTIDPTTVATGTSYLGINGTLLGNMWNGTCDNSSGDPNVACVTGSGIDLPGGSQANGGVDDYNGDSVGGTRPADSYATKWVTCNTDPYDAVANPGGNNCNTGENGNGSAEKDTATGLVWSYPCHGLGCATWDSVTDPNVLTAGCLTTGCAYSQNDTYYNWDGSGQGNDGDTNNGLTAQQLCSNNPNGSGWFLPDQKQLMQAYIDGAYGNLEPKGVGRYYWSSTTVSWDASLAWGVGLSGGVVSDDVKGNQDSMVRCVRVP